MIAYIAFALIAVAIYFLFFKKKKKIKIPDIEFLYKRRPPNSPYSPAYAIARAKGRRPTMEDNHAVDVDIDLSIPGFPEASFLSVFDGHAGEEASLHLKANLHKNIISAFQKQYAQKEMISPERAIKEGFLKTDSDFLDYARQNQNPSGSTCVSAFITHNRLIVANVGDSRAILCLDRIRSYTPGGHMLSETDIPFVEMSIDHKPNRPDEKSRIESNGGIVMHVGCWRVQGVLATSRAFGDKDLKKYVIAEPELREVALPSAEMDLDRILSGHEAEFKGTPSLLVLASDGLWDVFTNQEVADFVHHRREKDLYGADELLQAALHRGSVDNITIIVVDLRRYIDGHSPFLGRPKLE
eukprot:TRINITY_DN578_c0_g2_i1.p1 TRINITY_DN578_c0_g2~~TRINITY_DN578_c0_g2_i1.p1  ORF type:complete len:355 (-),score=81.14 TRINITY_DN578_c0_g2_i1:550-1614(-)